MKRFLVLAALSATAVTAGAQTATTFEMRCFTADAAADGVTDFHGETEWLTTPQRVELLGQFARFASRFWGDPGLDTPLFGESAVAEALSRIKPQPLTSVRRTLPITTSAGSWAKPPSSSWKHPTGLWMSIRTLRS